MQIIRSMLSKYSADFEKYIKSDNEKILPNFGKNKYLNPNFTSDEKIQKNKSKNVLPINAIAERAKTPAPAIKVFLFGFCTI